MSRNSESVTARNSYTAEELARLGLPGYPRTRKNWYVVVKRQGWESIEVPGKGPGGLRREYIPPPEVKALIELRQRGGLPAASSMERPTSSAPGIQSGADCFSIVLILAGTLQAMGKGADPMKAASKAIDWYQGFANEEMRRFDATALGLILAGVLEGMGDKGGQLDYQRAASKAVAYYLQALRQGWIAPDGSSSGPGGA